MKSDRVFSFFRLQALALSLLAILWSPFGRAEEPGRGRTAELELSYLQFIADHHFAALRMTELAAGTDTRRDTEISASEGTSPTPGFALTAAKASLDDIRSLARQENRVQREEITTALKFLKEWYGMDYRPRVRDSLRPSIQRLETANPGNDFNRAFLTTFSGHHYSAIRRSVDCLVGRELRHTPLHAYCENIVITQTNQINEMREWLCDIYKVCDFLPQTAASNSSDAAGSD